MGYKLRPTKSVINPYDGSANTTAYAIIDAASSDKRRQSAHIDLTIYANRAARIAGHSPLGSYGVDVTQADYVTYFGPSSNVTIWAQAQAYLVARGIPNTSFVAGDWMIEPLDTGGEP